MTPKTSVSPPAVGDAPASLLKPPPKIDSNTFHKPAYPRLPSATPSSDDTFLRAFLAATSDDDFKTLGVRFSISENEASMRVSFSDPKFAASLEIFYQDREGSNPWRLEGKVSIPLGPGEEKVNRVDSALSAISSFKNKVERDLQKIETERLTEDQKHSLKKIILHSAKAYFTNFSTIITSSLLEANTSASQLKSVQREIKNVFEFFDVQ